MNKLFKTILAVLIMVFGIGFLSAGVALADPVDPDADNLIVNFQHDPLFGETNFLPGDAEVRWAEITNNSGQKQKIGVEIVDKDPCSETYCLSDKLNLVISKINTNGSESVLYDDSLTYFYEAGEVHTSDLNTGESVKYNFSVTFFTDSDNNYQNSTVKFNIKIGFFGKESISDEIKPGGGGGNGGVSIFGLTISDELASNIETNQATITWNTNEKATSRVIFSAESEPRVFSTDDPPNYGYAHSTIEEDTPAAAHGKTGSHTVIIGNLSADTTYHFRCVSHASPPTVSRTHTFTTLALADVDDGDGEPTPGPSPREDGAWQEGDNDGDGDDTGGGIIPETYQRWVAGATDFIGDALGFPKEKDEDKKDGEVRGEEDEKWDDEEADKEDKSETFEDGNGNGKGKSIFSHYYWWSFLLALLLIILLLWYRRKKKEKEN